METRLIIAIVAWFFSGIYGFLQKVDVEEGINRSTFVMYSYFGMIVCGALYMLFSGGKINLDWGVLIYAFLNASIYAIVFTFRLKSLKFVDSSTFFINYRILSSILLIFFSYLFFHDSISPKEYLGIFIGFITFYLLYEKKEKKESNKKFNKGIIYLLAGVVGICIIQVANKYFAMTDIDYVTYLILCGFFGSIATYFLKGKEENLKSILIVKDKKLIIFLAISGLIFALNNILNFYALRLGGNVVVVYKIVSYSLFIPIILSVIIYKEKITLKKLIAFILTILSIFLFAK